MDSFNRKLCRACQGACCKTMPGASTPADWGAPHIRTMRRALIKAFKTGKWRLAMFAKELPGVLYIQPATTNTGCVFLSEQGCSLSDKARPQACRELIPASDFPLGCHAPVSRGENPMNAAVYYAALWKPYQDLIRFVATITDYEKQGVMYGK